MLQGSVVESEYTITEEEYVKANKLFTKASRNVLVVYVIVVMFLLIIAVIVNSSNIKFTAIGALIGGAIGNFVVRDIYAPWRTRNQYRNYQAAQELIHITLSDDSVNFKSSSGEAILNWTRINKWRENSEFILIYQAPEVYHIIPKRIGKISIHLTKSLVEQVGKAT